MLQQKATTTTTEPTEREKGGKRGGKKGGSMNYQEDSSSDPDSEDISLGGYTAPFFTNKSITIHQDFFVLSKPKLKD